MAVSIGTSANDVILGTNESDQIYGVTGNDILTGLGSTDTIFGGEGDDVVGGNGGADSLFGGSGKDLLSGDSGNDDLRGGDGDDRLFGRLGNDQIRGQDGDDTGYGGGGNDSLFGAGGDDSLRGGGGDDRLGGGSGTDTLVAGNADDTLNGGSGVDTAEGGAGDDSFFVDEAGDIVRETAGGGFDELFSEAANYVLAGGEFGYIERAVVGADAGDSDLRGNEYDNILVGNKAGDNVLVGRSGADTLNGQSGSDIMQGGSGDDTFLVETSGDQVRELADGGVDLVRSEVRYTLPDGTATAFIENLTLRNVGGDIAGGGNSLDNTILGNNANNVLRGFGGEDVIEGGDGDDRLFGGAEIDRLYGGSGSDLILMQEGDVVFGGADADSFRFNGDTLGKFGSGGPVIRDFDGERLNAGNGEDKLVFDTGLETGTFAYIGAAAFSGGGDSEARFDGNRQVQVDQNGDGIADIAFEIQKLTAANQLTATDFVWS
ncbi:MAG: calcium-binding protein [Rhodospirillales bacterium]